MLFVLFLAAGLTINSINADVRDFNDFKAVVVDTFSYPVPADWSKLND